MPSNFASQFWNHFEFCRKLSFFWIATPTSCSAYPLMGPTCPRFWVLSRRNSKCILSFGVECSIVSVDSIFSEYWAIRMINKGCYLILTENEANWQKSGGFPLDVLKMHMSQPNLILCNMLRFVLRETNEMILMYIVIRTDISNWKVTIHWYT